MNWCNSAPFHVDHFVVICVHVPISVVTPSFLLLKYSFCIQASSNEFSVIGRSLLLVRDRRLRKLFAMGCRNLFIPPSLRCCRSAGSDAVRVETQYEGEAKRHVSFVDVEGRYFDRFLIDLVAMMTGKF